MKKQTLVKMGLVLLPAFGLFTQPVLAEEGLNFSSCQEAWANGYADIHQGEPGYSAKLDRDHDGIACELSNAPKGAYVPRQASSHTSEVTNEWIQKDGYWYYVDGQGKPVVNTWKGNFYLKSDGKMAQSEWIYDTSYQAWYYLKSDGSYAYSAWQGAYYLKSNGKMAQSEWVYDSSYQAWYYLKSDGSYAHSAWQENYYLKSDGKMAISEWVDSGRYYVDASGLWKP